MPWRPWLGSQGLLTCLVETLQVQSAGNARVGQWARVFVTSPNSTRRRLLRRALLGAADGLTAAGQRQAPRRGLRQEGEATQGVPSVAQLLFDDPKQQEALAAAFAAEVALQEQVASTPPDKVRVRVWWG